MVPVAQRFGAKQEVPKLDASCSTALHAVRPVNLMLYNPHIRCFIMVQQWSLWLNALVPNKR
jgi:hypothetical protein